MLFLAFMACNAQAWYETAGLVTSTRNFETERYVCKCSMAQRNVAALVTRCALLVQHAYHIGGMSHLPTVLACSICVTRRLVTTCEDCPSPVHVCVRITANMT